MSDIITRPPVDPRTPHGLPVDVLKAAAADYARMYGQRDQRSRADTHFVIGGPGYVMQSLQGATYKDEFERLVNDPDWGIKAHLPLRLLKDFERRASEMFTPRADSIYCGLLADKLAITPDGRHIPGRIGSVQVNVRPLRRVAYIVEKTSQLRLTAPDGTVRTGPIRRREKLVPTWEQWPVYAGEADERASDSGRPDDLPDYAIATRPDGSLPAGVGANVSNWAALAVIDAVDALVDFFDVGSTAATIRLRTGSQPADPDATESGTLLGTLTCSDPASAGAVDDTDGTVSATFDSVTDDGAADASDTVTYCRIGATGSGVDDVFDGNAGTSDEAFVFNTTSIVSGSVISLTSAVAGMSQGSTAS